MKRKGSWLAIVVAMTILLALVLPISSLAEEEIKVEVIADPVELSEGGPVLLTFEISNYSDFELHEITIGLDNAIFTIEGMEDCVIPPGGSATFPLQYEVPNSKIGRELLFQVSWLKYGEPHTEEVPVTIARAIEPVISIERTASNLYAKQGETITLTYKLVNQTKFDMTNITVIDEQISNNPIFRNHTLNAGGTITQSFVYTMGADSVVSAPIVTYDVNGKTKTFSAIDPITLAMVLVEINLKVEIGTPTAAGVPFTITATNAGNQNVSNIRITDELNNPVHSDAFSLAPGENKTFSYLVVPIPTEPIRNVAFRLTGTDALGAAYAPVYDQVYEVHPFVDDSQINVVLVPEILDPWSAQTGAVRVRVTIQNSSAVELTNAVLSETMLGELATYDMLSLGNTVYEQELIIGSPRNLTFSIKANDPTGTERLLTGVMLTVAYPTATDAPLPTSEATPEPTGNTTSWNSTLVTVFVIIGVIMLVAFLALIILAVMEHRKTGGLLIDDENEDDDEIDESIDLAFEETSPRSPQLAAPKRPEDYVRIAEQRRQQYVPTRRPLMPTVIPEFDDGIEPEPVSEETIVLQRREPAAAPRDVSAQPTRSTTSNSGYGVVPEEKPMESAITSAPAGRHSSPPPAQSANEVPTSDKAVAYWLSGDPSTQNTMDGSDQSAQAPKRLSFQREPAVREKRREEIHRVPHGVGGAENE